LLAAQLIQQLTHINSEAEYFPRNNFPISLVMFFGFVHNR